MGEVLHGRATTTEAIRRAIQNSHESLRRLCQALRHQSEDGGEVEEPDLSHRCSDWPERTEVDRAID